MKYEELSQIFASLLTKPAEEIAGHYLVKCRIEFENLRLEYLNDNDYAKAREQLYAEKVKFIKEYKGELNFDVTKYLKDALEVAMPIAADSTKYTEAYEPGIIALLRWYKDGTTVQNRVVYGTDFDDVINNYTIVAEAKGKTPITLEFKYLKQLGTLRVAAELWATAEVLKEIRGEQQSVSVKSEALSVNAAVQEATAAEGVIFDDVFKGNVLTKLLDYFSSEQKPLLTELIINGTEPEIQLNFMGQQNQMVEFLRRAKYRHHIFCNSYNPLQEWICRYFKYQTAAGFRRFHPERVADILKSNDRVGKQPILTELLPLKSESERSK